MPSLLQFLSVIPALLAVANGQGVIKSAQGTSGSPASTGLQVSLTNTADANIINKTEISSNFVNECGRTLLAGNIDIGQTTEDQLANKTVTSVTKGGKVAVTISEVNANGAGPYTCDLDPTSNSKASGQINLTVAETDPSSTSGDITLSITMPTDLACTGASTGNVCTVRCYNAANYGGCFAVEQTDVTAAVNTVANIATAQTLSGVLAQVLQNQKDLSVAVAANHEATNEAQQGTDTVSALLANNAKAKARRSVARRVFVV